MSKEPAKKLYDLQDLLIDEFIARIRSGEASPADLSAARQLLKDNSISAILVDTNPLAELVKVLPFKEEGIDRAIKKVKNE
jgi:ABC-type Zn uptake system ZnuABC Zn-binding protein ZnuA|tara:strand:- start:70 stop:312 length:243 start_codon:yes stop_codon:yes gene_type:complete